jgi:hypothetical protein
MMVSVESASPLWLLWSKHRILDAGSRTVPSTASPSHNPLFLSSAYLGLAACAAAAIRLSRKVQAIADMNPTSSRATVVITIWAFFPLASSWRYLLLSRRRVFQAMSLAV